jgi:long-subunit acyl-CoA synthetase (AMP-forming)
MHNFHKHNVISHTFCDRLPIMKYFKNLLGGKVRMFLTGSASIDPEILTFIKLVYSSPVLFAYGCTENTGPACLSSHHDHT